MKSCALYRTHTHRHWRQQAVARSRSASRKRFQWTQLLYFICLWTISAPVRFGNIIHYISAPERDRLQKNETNHSVRPRLLLSESIVRPACIGWGNGVDRRGVSLTARRLTVCWRYGSASQHGVRRRPQQVVCALAKCSIRLHSLKECDEAIMIWLCW